MTDFFLKLDMKNDSEIVEQLAQYRKEQKTKEGVYFLMKHYDLQHPLLKDITFRDEISNNSILLTAEGSKEKGFTIRIPNKILYFDYRLVANLLMHEILHLYQRSGKEPIEERSEREWQAYTEMIFHQRFPQLPTLSNNLQIQFAKKALKYYQQMGEESSLQDKYLSQKNVLEIVLKQLESEEKIHKTENNNL